MERTVSSQADPDQIPMDAGVLREKEKEKERSLSSARSRKEPEDLEKLDLEAQEDPHSSEQEEHDGEDEEGGNGGEAEAPPHDPNGIGWDGPDDPENPRNWTFGKKWAAVSIASLFTLISPIASSMVAPGLPEISRDLHIGNEVLSQMSLSIFVLSYAVGPLFLGPLSEVYGRVPVIQIANLWFLIFNLVCGFANNTAELLVFRFLAGLGGSAPLAIGGGVVADCFSAEQRATAIALYTLGPVLGPALGPIAGGFITETIGWRWVFWIVSIADAAVQFVGLFLLRETWAPVLLARKAARLSKETGNNELHPTFTNSEMKLSTKLRTSLSRPFIMLFTQPIVICLALYMAFIYGVIYIVISTFSSLFTDVYGESVGISGLNYLAQAIGYTAGTQATARFNTWIYGRLKKREGGKGRPEFRVIALIPGSILIPIGLFWYGWSAQARIFWIMPDIGIAIYAIGVMCANQVMQTYIIDTYTRYAASALAATTFLRSLAGFGFPLFATYMYNALGYGWGNSLLAFVSIAFGIPAPFFFWFYGAKLRAKSRFAAGSS